MAINVSQAFKRTSIAPIDETLALTKAQMVATVDTLMPAYYFTICQDDGKIYLYDKSATPSASTGKFTEFSGGGGGGSSDVKFFTTTDTLSKTINGTKVVAAADLPGVTWSDLKVGSSVIKDAKGTMGLVTAITGTTSVTVTTATTSTPTVELTQAQYDALATKDPDTIYFITDSQPNAGTYMGAYETIYSTTERVVGSYMGKPLYQKVFDMGSQVTIGTSWGTISQITPPANLDNIVKSFGIKGAGAGSNDDGAVQFFIGYENGAIIAKSSVAVSCRYVIMQYTKTTDTASAVEYANVNDYSTSEKIVGTWIDGRPIYQKTVDLGSLPNNSTKTVTAGISNFDRLIDFQGTFSDGESSYVMPQMSSNLVWVLAAYYKQSTDSVVIMTTQDYSPYTGYVTIRYVKTS